MGDERTRTYNWSDPRAIFGRWAELSGLELIRAMLDGTVPHPPMADTLGFRAIEASEGHAVFASEPAEWLYNPIGVVHGGWAMTILDSALGVAVHTTLARGERYTTLETKVNFVRPVLPDTGPVRCEASVVHRGRRIATADGRLIETRGGKLLAHGTTTCLIESTERAQTAARS